MKNINYAVRGPLVKRATKIQAEIDKGIRKSFDFVIKANIGDCHAVGQHPITFFRQVLSLCVYPDILKTRSDFPSDVISRGIELLNSMHGSVGCYTDSKGNSLIRNEISTFIKNRDGYISYSDDIFITNGASSAIRAIIYALSNFQADIKKSGFLVPIPQYPLYSATINEYNSVQIPYQLDEENNWNLDIHVMERELEKGRLESIPKAVIVINPGNPTGQVLDYNNMVEIVKFCNKHNLVLMADEVYQENVYYEERPFYSFKRVVGDIKNEVRNIKLISFHSISKGFYGECGIRGGYMEMVGFDDHFKSEITKLLSVQLCSSTCGQIILSCLANPPKINEPSYDKFIAEKKNILESLKEKSEIVYRQLNCIEGISCNKAYGALYAFPRVHLSESAIKTAMRFNMTGDEFYCHELLEETGICVVPGSGFGQAEGTFHFRMTILPSIDVILLMISKIRNFQFVFRERYG